VSALGPPAPFRPRLLPRPLYACASASFLIAGAGVAAWNAVQPFAHGWWLASFLTLVGGVAQALLAATAARTVLWNAGTLLVPLGVLTDIRLPVVLGSCALMAVLVRVTLDIHRGDLEPRQRVRQHRAWFLPFLGFMAISVLVGTALAWDLPWM
jgi:hypothetical protein